MFDKPESTFYLKHKLLDPELFRCPSTFVLSIKVSLYAIRQNIEVYWNEYLQIKAELNFRYV